ncbi:regulatory inactivation of DnaA Hda protein [Magnetospira thiophila]
MTVPQMPLELGFAPALGAEDFLVAPCNREAVGWLDRWPDWPAPALILHGPAGCGKTHLASLFLRRTGGRELVLAEATPETAVALLEQVPVLFCEIPETVLGSTAERCLLHAYNTARDLNRHLLLTARRAALSWGVALPDLRSRLLGAPAAAIKAPDDPLLTALLVKLLADRHLKVEEGVLHYLLPRMERSFQGAADLVAALDRESLARKKAVTLALARQVLQDLAEMGAR